MRPAALFIDAMGTLVTLEDPVGRLREELARRFGVVVDGPRARAALAAEIAHYRAHMHAAADPAGLAALRRACAEVLAVALGPPLSETDPRAMTDALLVALRFRADPEAAPALHRARSRWPALRILVVSNWDAGLPAVLTQAGLGAGVDEVLSSARAGAAKPDPRIFARALALAGVPARDAGRVVHVGDSVGEDITGARAAGLRAVLVHRGPGATPEVPAGVPIIARLSELVPTVSALAPR